MKRKFLHKMVLCALLLFGSVHLINAQNSKTPMMGWSSWNTFRINISETLIQETADAMISKGLKDAGYTFVNIDDGFFAGRNTSTGVLNNNNTKFPSGMRAISDYIHSKGLKTGIYSEAGDKTCAYYWDDDKVNGLNVGFYNYETQDANLYFDTWNFDFIKIDYCGAEYLGLDEQTQYTKIWNAIKGTNKFESDGVRWNVCRWMFPGTWVTEIAGSWRISHDIRLNFDSTLGVRDVFEHNLYLSAYASPGHFNDMDMMQIGRGLTVNQEKSHFGLWCIMNSPLMIGCDLRSIPDATLNIITNKEVIALNQDVLGLQAQVVSRSGKQYVMAKQIEVDQGKVRGVALFNGESTAKTMRINFADICLSEKAVVRDLWEQKDLGTFTGYYEVSVPAYGTAMLRIEGESSFDQITFEGENAFINEYNGVKVDKGTYTSGIFSSKIGASGDYILKNLGGTSKPDNWAEFRRVYSSEGGKYKFKLFYYSGTDKDLIVTVNGTPYTMAALNSGGANKRGRAFIDEIELQKGYNTIRFSSTTGTAPDIDKFVLLDPSDPGDDNEPDYEDETTMFPTLSSEDDSDETWYYIQFSNGKAVVQDMGDGVSTKTAAKSDTAEAQLWKVVASATTDKYYIINKSGRKMYWASSRYQASSTNSTLMSIVESTNSTYTPAWEIQRNGTTSSSMNQHGGAGVGIELGEWSKGDDNNPLLFIKYEEPMPEGFPKISNSSEEHWYYIQFNNGGGALQYMGEDTNMLNKKVVPGEADQHWKVIKASASSGDFKYQIVNKNGQTISHVASSETSDGFFQTTFDEDKMATFQIVETTNATYTPGWELGRYGSSRFMNQYKGAGLDRSISEWNKGDQGNPLSFISIDDVVVVEAFMPEISSADNSDEHWYHIEFADAVDGQTAYLQDMGAGLPLMTKNTDAAALGQYWKVIDAASPSGNHKYNFVSFNGNTVDFDASLSRYVASSTGAISLRFNEIAPYWGIDKPDSSNGQGMSQTAVGPDQEIREYYYSADHGLLKFVPATPPVSIENIDGNLSQLDINGRSIEVKGESVAQVNIYTIAGQLLASKTSSFKFTFATPGYYLITIIHADNRIEKKKLFLN